jgi:hypothetical protein
MCACFPKTDGFEQETPVVSSLFHGTFPSFITAAASVCSSTQLRATGAELLVKDILGVFCDGELFAELGLYDVDAIVVQRMGRHIVRIENMKEDRPHRGCTVFIEMNDVRARAKDLLTTLKANSAEYTTASFMATAVAGVVVGGGLFYLFSTLLDKLKK